MRLQNLFSLRVLSVSAVVAFVAAWLGSLVSEPLGIFLGIAVFLLAWLGAGFREDAPVLYCPYCRKRVKAGASVCHHCGRDVKAASKPEPTDDDLANLRMDESTSYVELYEGPDGVLYVHRKGDPGARSFSPGRGPFYREARDLLRGTNLKGPFIPIAPNWTRIASSKGDDQALLHERPRSEANRAYLEGKRKRA
jgi:hypothetical protein